MKLTLQRLRLDQGRFRLELDVEITGQTVGIFGRSGTGKTSLLELVAGLRRPVAGKILVDDLDLTSLPPEKRHLGYVPQDLALFPHLSVRQNLLYGQRPETSTPGLNLPHVAEVLAIGSLLDHAVPLLSGGQKQRVAFARALLASPRLLLMDEPLANLDQELKEKLVPYLIRIREEFRIPMLYVSHAPQEIQSLCDQVIVLKEGRCLRTCSPGEIFTTATTTVLKPGVYD